MWNGIVRWIAENKEWLFSGIGVTALAVVYKMIASLVGKSRNLQTDTRKALDRQSQWPLRKPVNSNRKEIRLLQATRISSRSENHVQGLAEAESPIQAGQRLIERRILSLLAEAVRPMTVEEMQRRLKLRRWEVLASTGRLEAKAEVREHLCSRGLAYAITAKGAGRCAIWK